MTVVSDMIITETPGPQTTPVPVLTDSATPMDRDGYTIPAGCDGYGVCGLPGPSDSPSAIVSVSPTPSLPATGTPAAGILGGGSVVLLVGVLAVVLARRRRTSG